MLTWLAVKTFFKKSWAFVKKYWKYFIAFIYGMGVWLYFKYSKKDLKELIKLAEISHEKEIDAINEAHSFEIEARNKVIKKYTEVLDVIEKEYDKKRENLASAKKDEIKKLVEENIDNPSALAKLISERYGIIYVEGGAVE